MKKIVISVVIVAAIVLVVGFVPLIEVPYPVTVQYQDTETYYVQEPYQETIEILVPLQYQVVTGGGSHYVQYRTIMNRDEVAGYFAFRQTIYVIDKDDWLDIEWERQQGINIDYDSDPRFTRYDLEEIIYLEPGETGTVTWDAQEIDGRPDTEIWVEGFGLSPEIVPDEKIVEDTVTKYKQVEKERAVTKERTETHHKKVPILEYLRSRF